MVIRLDVSLIVLVAASSVSASEISTAGVAHTHAEIASKVPPAKPEDVTLINGGALYEVRLGGGSFVYVTADAQYMVAGDLYQLNGLKNLSEERRTSMRADALASIKDSEAVVFDAAGPVKHTITVFTDIDCAYCRKLHSEIAQIGQLGIRVRYVAYPRSGPGTDSWTKAEAVWCAKDRQAAMTSAKLGEPISSPACEPPVGKHFELGKRIGVRGTPMILNEAGKSIGGYLPPAQLAERLDQSRSVVSQSSKNDTSQQ